MPEGKSEYPDDIICAAKRVFTEAMSFNTDYESEEVIAKALLAERQRHSSVSWGGHRIDIAAFRQLVEDGKAFADTDPEAQFIADADNSCPHCGGSGHKDDVRPPSSTEEI